MVRGRMIGDWDGREYNKPGEGSGHRGQCCCCFVPLLPSDEEISFFDLENVSRETDFLVNSLVHVLFSGKREIDVIGGDGGEIAYRETNKINR